MKASIIAEGRSDQAVILNILKGQLGIHQSDVKLDVPEYEFDQTDLAEMDPDSFSSWTVVKATCIERGKIETFLDTNPEGIVVVQIDTAERHQTGYGMDEPKKDKINLEDYSVQLRVNAIDLINQWISEPLPDRIAYAITIEETEAWLLFLLGLTNTENINNPKERFNREINRQLSDKQKKKFFSLSIFDQYYSFSRPLSKLKGLEEACKHNHSLRLFTEKLIVLMPPISE